MKNNNNNKASSDCIDVDIKNVTCFSYEEALCASVEYFDGEELAAKVFVDKYALRDNNNNLIEKTPDDMHRRMAKEFARIEASKFKKPLTEDEIYQSFKGFKRIVPQGSPMYGIGNTHQFISLSNCFVIDSPLDAYGSIMEADEHLVQISKRRGGVGTDLSNLRPNGAPTKNAARTSTGVVAFAERYSNSIREVGQAGRRGALMLTLSVHHPDILEFTNVKRNMSKITGANISIRLSDEFLNAVEKNEEYEQRWPVDSSSPKISKKVNAKEVWDNIVDNAHHMAEPGLLFWDNIIKESPADCYADVGFKTISTNPCVTADTWVFTSSGPRLVKELIGEQFDATVNGSLYSSDYRGFYKTGTKDVYEIETSSGYSVKCTADHPIKVVTFSNRQKKLEWKKAGEINVGEMIALSNHRDFEWEGNGTSDEGCY